jgi:Multicopper oxidase
MTPASGRFAICPGADLRRRCLWKCIGSSVRDKKHGQPHPGCAANFLPVSPFGRARWAHAASGNRSTFSSAKLRPCPLRKTGVPRGIALTAARRGPTIQANEGDRIRIVFDNHLPEPTGIHWHGLELPIEMDGVPGISVESAARSREYLRRVLGI